MIEKFQVTPVSRDGDATQRNYFGDIANSLPGSLFFPAPRLLSQFKHFTRRNDTLSHLVPMASLPPFPFPRRREEERHWEEAELLQGGFVAYSDFEV